MKGPYVVCAKHGTELIKGLPKVILFVRAPLPKNKRQRFLDGCPICAKEARNERNTAG